MTIINPKNDNDECFENALTVWVHQEETSDTSHRVATVRPLKRE